MSQASNRTMTESIARSKGVIQTNYVRDLAVAAGHRLEALGLGKVDEDSIIYAVFATFACGLLLLLFFAFRWTGARADRRDSVILVGTSGEGEAPGAGKTTLYKVLKTGHLPKYGVVSSVEPRESLVTMKKGLDVRLVDFPGSVILRGKLKTYLDRAKAVVFVVDGTTFSTKSLKDAALLHEVLTNTEVMTRKTPVLVFCNKTDIVGASNMQVVKNTLEKELERIRTSTENAMGDIGEAGAGPHFDEDNKPSLGIEGEMFSFGQMDSTVTFAAGSALRLKIAPVKSFIIKSFST